LATLSDVGSSDDFQCAGIAVERFAPCKQGMMLRQLSGESRSRRKSGAQ
jgi:hypothetical protein